MDELLYEAARLLDENHHVKGTYYENQDDKDFFCVVGAIRREEGQAGSRCLNYQRNLRLE